MLLLSSYGSVTHVVGLLKALYFRPVCLSDAYMHTGSGILRPACLQLLVGPTVGHFFLCICHLKIFFMFID